MRVITHLSAYQLSDIAESLSLQLCHYRHGGRRRDGRFVHQFVLRPKSSLWQRKGFRRQRINAVCWHGHYAFLKRLYALDADAVVRTALATYKGKADFEARAWATAMTQVGSLLEPEYYCSMCYCNDD